MGCNLHALGSIGWQAPGFPFSFGPLLCEDMGVFESVAAVQTGPHDVHHLLLACLSEIDDFKKPYLVTSVYLPGPASTEPDRLAEVFAEAYADCAPRPVTCAIKAKIL